MATGPAELPVGVDGETVQHQPSADTHEKAHQRAGPPTDQANRYRHDGELRTPVDVLARGSDRHRDAERHAERHDADERIG
ncbi:MAG TPA: hypothetical protein VN683_12580 [Acidothermaceae bacterium]|nr:hypothetical protein [Acidothermaceae bacterium]